MSIIMCLLMILSLIGSFACADESDVFTYTAKPNILIVIGNSNNFDENFYGDSVCSWKSDSRSVVSRKVIIDLVNTYVDKTRIGLMTFKLPSSSKYYLHNSPYFVSYDQKSYCPGTPPTECIDYCKTGDAGKQATCQATCSGRNATFDATYLDEIITHYPVGSEQRNRYCELIYPKKNKMPNSTDIGNYIYYNLPGTMYAGGNYGNCFCYSSGYDGNESTADNYACYWTKTGNSDANAGYSNLFFSSSFTPTDEDIALGFYDFGRRLAWTYSGRTWFANTSTGTGYLHVTCDDNKSGDGQKNALLAKLATKENDETGYMSCNNTADPNACSYIINAGLTPTAGTFQAAIDYFKGANGYASPIQGTCQKNFIIFLTNGLPNVNESGQKDTATNLLPGAIAKLTSLRSLSKDGATYDIQTYVVGLGLTDQHKVKLDQLAVAGGTDVDGHAYYADKPEDVTTAIGKITQDILSKVYSFSVASVSAVRVSDENYLYESLFTPTADPFWQGNLKKFSINADGTLTDTNLDAGKVLSVTAAADRTIKTYKFNGTSNVFMDFNTSNISASDLGVATDAQRDAIVGYIRGEDSFSKENWKLGDTFHSGPITIGTPSPYFNDVRDTKQSFKTFRDNHTRSSANNYRYIVLGANDGQLHAFHTKDMSERWSFIPPNLLSRLWYLAHSTEPYSGPHRYLVDGPITVADVWKVSAVGDATGKEKKDSEWKTLMVFGEGRGGSPNLWSSRDSCDSDFNPTYTSTYSNYCGYYALDMTDEKAAFPHFLWRLSPSDASIKPYLGEPWSKMMVGRIILDGKEKWVGFMGAGYNAADEACTGVCDLRGGKGFFIVDLSDGSIIWSNTNTTYSLPASAAIVDTDNDGFIDRAYIGDLGGNVWRFQFCSRTSTTCTSTASWPSPTLLYQNSGGPIYTMPAVAKDSTGQIWVYWGTGNKNKPMTTGSSDVFIALKDVNTSTTYTSSDLQDITNSVQYTETTTKAGFKISLDTSEKMLADPAIFKEVIYFTTFMPVVAGSDVCSLGGSAKLYAISYINGMGAFENSARSKNVGAGIATTPIVSIRPDGSGADLYLTVSGIGNIKAPITPPSWISRTNLLNIRNMRVQ